MMTNNFIKLTSDGKVLMLNAMFIEAVEEMEGDTCISMSLNSNRIYRVEETVDVVMKKIDETGTFKTILK